jgi:sarcosine oxidase subunit delta
MRNNPAGPHSELWYHAAACRRFLKVERDTRTHAILSASAI